MAGDDRYPQEALECYASSAVQSQKEGKLICPPGKPLLRVDVASPVFYLLSTPSAHAFELLRARSQPRHDRVREGGDQRHLEGRLRRGGRAALRPRRVGHQARAVRVPQVRCGVPVRGRRRTESVWWGRSRRARRTASPGLQQNLLLCVAALEQLSFCAHFNSDHASSIDVLFVIPLSRLRDESVQPCSDQSASCFLVDGQWRSSCLASFL